MLKEHPWAETRRRPSPRRHGTKAEQSAYHIWRRYGLTAEDHAQMIIDQDGRCAVCLEDKPLVVDHDHATGKVRALLCRECNIALGAAGDNSAILLALASYLMSHQR